MPSYQSTAVKSYFTNHKPSYTATQYNNSETVRGYPDVSANGANYAVAVDGSISLVYGTSASSPTFGSVITLINEQRVNAGKSAVGFINPTLYANPSILNDITSGGNQGCGTAGFTAVSGWDPVTGLGTPNYGKMLPVFMALPWDGMLRWAPKVFCGGFIAGFEFQSLMFSIQRCLSYPDICINKYRTNHWLSHARARTVATHHVPPHQKQHLRLHPAFPFPSPGP